MWRRQGRRIGGKKPVGLGTGFRFRTRPSPREGFKGKPVQLRARNARLPKRRKKSTSPLGRARSILLGCRHVAAIFSVGYASGLSSARSALPRPVGPVPFCWLPWHYLNRAGRHSAGRPRRPRRRQHPRVPGTWPGARCRRCRPRRETIRSQLRLLPRRKSPRRRRPQPGPLRSGAARREGRTDRAGHLQRPSPTKVCPPSPNFTKDQLYDIAQYLHMQVELVANRGTLQAPQCSHRRCQSRRGLLSTARGGCKTCHSVTGDLAQDRQQVSAPEQLQTRFMWPGGGRGGANAQKVTVTLPSGQYITGTLRTMDDVDISMYDAAGQLSFICRAMSSRWRWRIA